jgi:hypothetical protein
MSEKYESLFAALLSRPELEVMPSATPCERANRGKSTQVDSVLLPLLESVSTDFLPSARSRRVSVALASRRVGNTSVQGR